MLFRSDRKSTRLNSSHTIISYAVFCLKKKKSHRSPPAPPRRPPDTAPPSPATLGACCGAWVRAARLRARPVAVLISAVAFFFNDTATTEIYTLSLHDALPI